MFIYFIDKDCTIKNVTDIEDIAEGVTAFLNGREITINGKPLNEIIITKEELKSAMLVYKD